MNREGGERELDIKNKYFFHQNLKFSLKPDGANLLLYKLRLFGITYKIHSLKYQRSTTSG